MNISFVIAALVFILSTILFVAGVVIIVSAKSKTQRNRTRWLIWMLIALIIMIISSFIANQALSAQPRTTTIGQFNEELTALADQTPTVLVYTESIGAPDTFSVRVDDADFAGRALNRILSASVSTQGCQVDMYQLKDEDFCFEFGAQSYTFGFIPGSYFCFDGMCYELGENQIDEIREALHEMTPQQEPLSKWYGDEAELVTRFMDNGDEARSITELTLSAGGETVSGCIEGAYDVLSIEKQPDGYVISYTYGDFYSHEAVRSSRVTVEDGKLVVTDME